MPFAGAVIENTIQSSFNYYDDLPNVAVAWGFLIEKHRIAPLRDVFTAQSFIVRASASK
jgi:hypothetical protein